MVPWSALRQQILFIGVLLGCSDTSSPAFELVRVQPATIRNSVETRAIVEGKQFYDALDVHLNDKGPPTITRGWGVWVDALELPRTRTSRIDANSLSIVLPAGLLVGTHDLSVTDPRGQTRKLIGALTVVADSGTAIPSATAGATSLATGGTRPLSTGDNTGGNAATGGGGQSALGSAGSTGTGAAGGTSGGTKATGKNTGSFIGGAGSTGGFASSSSGGTGSTGGFASSSSGGAASMVSGGASGLGDAANGALSQFCDSKDPSLVACYRFESSSTPGQDESRYGNHATVKNAGLVSGFDGTSIKLSSSSDLHVAESPTLDVHYITIEMWIRPDALPSGTRAGLLDNEGQYGFFVLASGVLRCTTTSDVAETTIAVTPLAWTHVACTYDGSCVRIFVNGIERANTAWTGDIGTTGNTGTSIGSNNPSGDEFVGLLDDVRIWNVARTAQQICVAAQACTQ